MTADLPSLRCGRTDRIDMWIETDGCREVPIVFIQVPDGPEVPACPGHGATVIWWLHGKFPGHRGLKFRRTPQHPLKGWRNGETS